MNNLSGITVIITTFCRVPLFNRLIISLEEAVKKYNGPTEILIIDNSPEPEDQKIKNLCKKFGARYLRSGRNVRKKLNLGIKESKFPILLFTDSDCEVSPNLLSSHLEFYKNKDVAGVGGRVIFKGEKSILFKAVEKSSLMRGFNNKKNNLIWTANANVSYRKEVLTKIGLFDTGFPFKLGGEDVDLGIRINKMGLKIKYSPTAIIFHSTETWNNAKDLYERAFRWGRLEYFLFCKHFDKRIKILPNFFSWTIIVFLVLFSVSTKLNSSTIIGFSLWIVISLFLFSYFSLKSQNEKININGLLMDILSSTFELFYQLGYCLEALKKLNYKAFTNRLIFFVFDEKNDTKYEIFNYWSNILALLAVIAIIIGFNF